MADSRPAEGKKRIYVQVEAFYDATVASYDGEDPVTVDQTLLDEGNYNAEELLGWCEPDSIKVKLTYDPPESYTAG